MLANLKQCKHTYPYTDSQAHTYFTDGVCDGQTWLTASPLKQNEAMQKACAAVVCCDWLLVCFEELASNKKKDLMNCTKKGNVCVHFPKKVDSSTLNSPRVGVVSSTGISSRCCCVWNHLLVRSFSNPHAEHGSWVHYISKKWTLRHYHYHASESWSCHRTLSWAISTTSVFRPRLFLLDICLCKVHLY